jgi:molybdopterin/thiamine biosynthesis adenylyltransferase
MGIGEISWIGFPRPVTEGAARFLLDQRSPRDGGTILDEPFDIEYGPELAWGLAGRWPDLFVSTTEDHDELMLGLSWADRNGVPAVVGASSGGGWFGTTPPPPGAREPQDPVNSLAVAALLIDGVRERLSPLAGGLVTPEGRLRLNRSDRSHEQRSILQVGVGGVGVWAAVALSATYGERLHLHLWDFDHVSTENLNRQALFTERDALTGSPKADAARWSLARIFPRLGLSSQVVRVGPEHAATVSVLSPRPTAILSAVDNAATRLVLQNLGRELDLPVMQGGTATFAADCFSQTVGGPLLDDQMHGALTTAAACESHEIRQRGRCTVDASYVVPGMLAGAFMAYRLGQLGQGDTLAAMRWRLGDLPVDSANMVDGFGAGSDFGGVSSEPQGRQSGFRPGFSGLLLGRGTS